VSENLDLVRSIYAAWGCGDFSSLDWADPEIEYVIVDTFEPGRCTGVAEMRRAIDKVLEPWDHPRIGGDAYRELDDERVLVFNHLSGRGRVSGIEVGGMQRNGAALLHIRDGKVTRYTSYFDREHALADLGLEDG